MEEEKETYVVIKLEIKTPDLEHLSVDDAIKYHGKAEVIEEFATREEAYNAIRTEYTPFIHEGKWITKATLYFVLTHDVTVYRGFCVWDKYVLRNEEIECETLMDIYTEYSRYWLALNLLWAGVAEVGIESALDGCG